MNGTKLADICKTKKTCSECSPMTREVCKKWRETLTKISKLEPAEIDVLIDITTELIEGEI